MNAKVRSPKRKADKPKIEQDFRERGMYSSIEIDGFRRFEHLEINDLSRINIILGDNNSGKTSILEAIYTHACGQSISAFVGNIATSRRNTLTGALDYGEGIRGLFKDKSRVPYTFAVTAKLDNDSQKHALISRFEPSAKLADLDPRLLGKIQPYEITIEEGPEGKKINLQISDSMQFSDSFQINGQVPSTIQWDFIGVWEIQLDDKTNRFSLTYPPSTAISKKPFKQAVFHDILAHRKLMAEAKAYSAIKRYNVLDEFTNELRGIFPEVLKIDMIPYPDGSQAPVFIMNQDNEFLPIYLWGDGLRRWFYLLGQMIVYQKTVHLIDEADVSFHPSAQKEFSRLLYRYAEKYDNQIFLTTHNIEFADKLLDALYGDDGAVASNEDPVRIITLRLTEEKKDVDIWNIAGREAYDYRQNFSLELR